MCGRCGENVGRYVQNSTHIFKILTSESRRAWNSLSSWQPAMLVRATLRQQQYDALHSNEVIDLFEVNDEECISSEIAMAYLICISTTYGNMHRDRRAPQETSMDVLLSNLSSCIKYLTNLNLEAASYAHCCLWKGDAKTRHACKNRT